MSKCLSADDEVCGILLACYQQSLFWPEPDWSHMLEPHTGATCVSDTWPWLRTTVCCVNSFSDWFWRLWNLEKCFSLPVLGLYGHNLHVFKGISTVTEERRNTQVSFVLLFPPSCWYKILICGAQLDTDIFQKVISRDANHTNMLCVPPPRLMETLMRHCMCSNS